MSTLKKFRTTIYYDEIYGCSGVSCEIFANRVPRPADASSRTIVCDEPYLPGLVNPPSGRASAPESRHFPGKPEKVSAEADPLLNLRSERCCRSKLLIAVPFDVFIFPPFLDKRCIRSTFINTSQYIPVLLIYNVRLSAICHRYGMGRTESERSHVFFSLSRRWGTIKRSIGDPFQLW